jgi:hypothetical protein
MINILSLQELKRTGFSKLKQMFNNEPDIIIQERGKDACVLVDMAHYSYLRECELEIALIKARKEIRDGKFTVGTKEHIAHLDSNMEEK